MFSRFIVAAILAASLSAAMAGLPAANEVELPGETDRLVATGRLWVTVKYFHPYLAYRNIDWDQALLSALPQIRAAKTREQYEIAVRSMLKTLEATPAPSLGEGQRIWIHHGLPPEIGGPSSHFYSAFLYKPGTAREEASVPMGGFAVSVPLSEPVSSPATPSPAPERIYSDAYPSIDLRILAAYKIWGVFHYFFAYRDLMDEDWDALLPLYLPRVIAARDALDYNLTLAEWLTHTADSLAALESPTMTNYFGEAPVGLRLRLIEKHAVVTEILDPEAKAKGVKVGDIVKKLDNETLVDRFTREAKYFSASTIQSLGVGLTSRLLNGPDGSSAALTIEDNLGNRKELTLKRSKGFTAELRVETAKEPLQLLRGGIGYADLRSLKRRDVDAMFDKFRNAPAIIFDMRGVSADDASAPIAARLAAEADVPAAIVTGPIVAAPDLPQGEMSSPSASYFFVQTTGNSPQWKFKGKTVMLVDERTIGAGEQAALLFEAANKTEFVGSPTAGANTALTNFTIPGGIAISLSGEDIRHANGGKLQRMGIQPNVNAVATLTGIRTGKDEVLDKALDHLSPHAPKVLPARASLKRHAS